MWGLASPKSVGQTRSLDIQVRVNAAILSLKFIGQAGRLETQAGFLCHSLEAESLPSFSGKPQFSVLVPSTDWTRLTHIMEDNLLYLKSTNFKC